MINGFTSHWDLQNDDLLSAHLILFIIFLILDIITYIFIWIPISLSIKNNVFLLLILEVIIIRK